MYSYLLGYADQPVVNHRVAVITFGREVKIVQNFSNDYNAILHLLGMSYLKRWINEWKGNIQVDMVAVLLKVYSKRKYRAF